MNVVLVYDCNFNKTTYLKTPMKAYKEVNLSLFKVMPYSLYGSLKTVQWT